jgi:arginine decarboxylase
MAWSIEDARELYNIEGWGIGYFGINDRGHVTVHPTRDPERSLDLFELAMDLEAQGIRLPLLLRFSDILRTRIQTLTDRFEAARREFDYQGRYTMVYPIKVNQQRHVIEEILGYGADRGVGLEVGSKPELQAVLALTRNGPHQRTRMGSTRSR